jgi:hypothetical protein
MSTAQKPPIIHGVFQRLRIIQSDRFLNDLITEYVDQASQKHAIDPIKAMKEHPEDAEYRTLIAANKLPLRPGIDFIPSGTALPVFVGGFLRKFAPDTNFDDPAQVASGLARIGAKWTEKTAKCEHKASHFLFSMRPELQARCLHLGIPVQDILMAGAIGALNRFNAWVRPESTLGYVLGFHTDKPDPYVHGLLFPFDSKDNRMCYSRLAFGKGRGGDNRLDYQGYLHHAYEEFLADFAGITAPENARDRAYYDQAVVRGTLASFRDYYDVYDAVKGGTYTDKIKAFVEITRANAEDYRSPEALRSEQTKQRKRYAEEVLPLRADRAELKAFSKEMGSYLREIADELRQQAEIVRNARTAIDRSHQSYLSSPFAFRLIFVGDGMLSYPATITKEWAKGLPPESRAARLLLSDNNPFMWDAGAKEASHTRVLEAKVHAKVSRDSCDLLDGVMRVCEAAITKAGYAVGRADDAICGLAGRTPKYLEVEISNDPTPGIVSDPDKGLAAVRHGVIERANNQLIKFRPFNPETDYGRDFAPIGRMRQIESDDNSAEEVLPLCNRDAVPYAPTAIDPDGKVEMPDLDKALDEALAGLRIPRQIENRHV